MRRTWSLVASSESCSEARAAGAEAICTVPVTVFVSLPPVSTMPPITPAATSALAAIAADSGRSDSDQRRLRRGALAAGAAAGSSARAPAAEQQLGLGAHDGHDAVAQLGRRVDLHRGQRQRVGRDLQVGDLAPAVRAGRQVRLEALVLVVGQRAQDVGARVVAPGAGAHVIASARPPSWPRSFSRPRRMRPFTVPMGVSSIDAISEWVKPPK